MLDYLKPKVESLHEYTEREAEEERRAIRIAFTIKEYVNHNDKENEDDTPTHWKTQWYT